MTQLDIKTLDSRGKDSDNMWTCFVTFALVFGHTHWAAGTLVLKFIRTIRIHYNPNRVLLFGFVLPHIEKETLDSGRLVGGPLNFWDLARGSAPS